VVDSESKNEKIGSDLWMIVLGSDPGWALSDTKLDGEDLPLVRQRAASEQESKIEYEVILKERRD
jgi:hypothetical protein